MWIKSEDGSLYNLDYAHLVKVMPVRHLSEINERGFSVPHYPEEAEAAFAVVLQLRSSSDFIELTAPRMRYVVEVTLERICRALKNGITFMDLTLPAPPDETQLEMRDMRHTLDSPEKTRQAA